MFSDITDKKEQEELTYKELCEAAFKGTPFEKENPLRGRMRCVYDLYTEEKIERIVFNMNGTINIIPKKEGWMEEQPNTKIPAKKNKMITHAPVCK